MTALTLAFSGIAIAKQPGSHQPALPDTRWENCNRQFRGDDNVRGLDRAEERHEFKKDVIIKEYKENKSEFGDANDFKRRDHYWEPYNGRDQGYDDSHQPSLLDRNIDNARSGDIPHRTIENMDQRSLELMGTPSQETGYPLLQEIHRKDAGNRFKGGHPALFYGLRLFLMPQHPVNVLSLAH